MRFVADGMLGTLARWLRLMGINTSYEKDLSDKEMTKLVRETDRILLTRDLDLARILGDRSIRIESTTLEDQLNQFLSLFPELPLQPLTRCSICNGTLSDLPSTEVRDRVPEGVIEHYDTFWKCESCGKIYWPGSHHEKIKQTIQDLKRVQRVKT